MILVINGPCGIGKTTISKQLAMHIDGCVLISGDDIHNFIMNKEITNEILELTNINITSIVNNFIYAGYKNVIIDFVYENENHIQYLKDKIYPIPLICIRLTSDLATNLERNLKRRVNDIMSNDRVKYLHKIFLMKGESLGHEVDTNGKTVSETVCEVLKLISDYN